VKDDRRTTVVASTRNVVTASIWRDLLRDVGIPAEVLGEGGGGGATWFSSGYPSLDQYRLIVFEDDAARARELIDRAEAGEMSLPSED
jgi:Putative prokaryotic signal transducing protein